MVWKVRKCLCGLTQSPTMWNHTIDRLLQQLGFVRFTTEHGTYVRGEERIFIAIYVDDIELEEWEESSCEGEILGELQDQRPWVCRVVTRGGLGGARKEDISLYKRSTHKRWWRSLGWGRKTLKCFRQKPVLVFFNSMTFVHYPYSVSSSKTCWELSTRSVF